MSRKQSNSLFVGMLRDHLRKNAEDLAFSIDQWGESAREIREILERSIAEAKQDYRETYEEEYRGPVHAH